MTHVRLSIHRSEQISMAIQIRNEEKTMKAFVAVSTAAAFACMCFSAANARPLVMAGAAAPLTASYAQERERERGWEAPPPELDEMARHGFHDGVEGARKDYGNHRRPDVNNRDEFRHPHVPGRDREAYRRGYERGYQAGVEHLYRGRM
jgi:hypothetical protein